MSGILENYNEIQKKIKDNIGHTDQQVKVVAVSKLQSLEVMTEAYQAGIRDFGENYVQEFEKKAEYFLQEKKMDLNWHFIGALQTNKVKKAIPYTSLIHSVDRLSLIKEIHHQAKKINKVQDILLQVNVAGEESKSGCTVDQAPQLIDDLQQWTHIRLLGLMTMPPLYNEASKVKNDFSKLYELSKKWQNKVSAPHSLAELSMGASGDYIYAVQEGATIIRLGTILLGQRQ